MARFRMTLKALILCAVLPGIASASPAATPREVVETFQAGLLQVMKESAQLDIQQRYDRLYPIIRDSYQTEVMIRIVTGPFWQQASAEQQARLHDGFVRMGVSTLATLFTGYSGQTFNVVDERAGPQETMIVATQLEQPDDNPVPINYVTRRYTGRWYIIDVLLNREISELKVRQSEYRAVLAKDGVEGLIAALNAKADELVATKKPQ